MLASLFKKIGLILSLNDPRWGRGGDDKKPNQNGQDGKRPSDGPPDLDQLWKDFNARLNRLLRGNKKGGGPESGGFRPSLRGAGIGAGLIGAIVLMLWLLSGVFSVQEGQTAVVLTFGDVTHQSGPGINWRWPTPIQTHEIVNLSALRTVEIGYRGSAKNKQAQESLMLTDDENIIDIQFAVQYKVNDATKWLFSNHNPEEMVRQVSESAIREIVGRSKMDAVLYEGREKVARDVSTLIQQILDRYNAGVQVLNVAMQGVQPPEQVQTAFDDAVKAGQDRERQKNEGQAYANDVIPKAHGAASRLLQEAEGYKARVVADAQGDASRFKQVLNEYQKAPAVTRDRMYLETMQQIFSNVTKVMVATKSNNSMLYLPLDKLIAQSAADSATPTHAASAAPTLPAAPSNVTPVTPDASLSADAQRLRDARNRDGRDGRDRESR